MPAKDTAGRPLALISHPLNTDPTARPTLMVTWGVEHSFGGMTAMCLKRASLFHERGVPSAVVTFDANPELDAIRSAQLANGRLHHAVPLLNLHEYYASVGAGTGTVQAPTSGAEEDQWIESSRVSRTVDGSLMYIDHGSPGNAESRRRKYFRGDGSLYLTDTTLPHPEVPGRMQRKLQLLAADGSVQHAFSSAARLYRHWLTEVVDATNSDVIIDSKFSAGFLFSWKSAHAVKIVNFHSTHVIAGEDPLTGRLSSSHEKIIENREAWDGITFLTESQRSAFVGRFGDDSNSIVISNPVDGPDNLPDFDSRNPARIVHVGRLAAGKNIKAVIDIVNAVASSNIPVHLDLIGDGDERSRLEKHVRELGIDEIVTFHGHVDDVPGYLSTARALLLCSKFEGQSLAVLEAQAQGCVPVAFDVDFGPRDVIEDGYNGFLVPFGDEAAAAAAVTTLLEDDGLSAEMSARGYETSKKFGSDEIFSQWKKALEMARSSKKDRDELAATTTRLTSMQLHADGDLDLEVAVSTSATELAGFTLVVNERGTEITEGRNFAPYRETDGVYCFRIPADLRAQLPGSDALDVHAVIEIAGLKRSMRLGAAPKPQSVPYFTAYGNLSFK